MFKIVLLITAIVPMIIYERICIPKFLKALQQATTVSEVRVITDLAIFELRVCVIIIGLSLGALLYTLIKEHVL